MLISWEEPDVRVGREVGKPGVRERLLLGYLAGELTERRFTVVSLEDGMAQRPMTRHELAIWLTEGGRVAARRVAVTAGRWFPPLGRLAVPGARLVVAVALVATLGLMVAGAALLLAEAGVSRRGLGCVIFVAACGLLAVLPEESS